MSADDAAGSTDQQHAGTDDVIQSAKRLWQLFSCCSSAEDLQQCEREASQLSEVLHGCMEPSDQDAVSALFETELPNLLLHIYSRGLLSAAAAAGAAAGPSQAILQGTATPNDPYSLGAVVRLTDGVLNLFRKAHVAAIAPAIEDSGACR
jgi:hypothetical protein